MEITWCDVQRQWRATTRPGRPRAPGEKRRLMCMTEIRTCSKKAECTLKCARINPHTFVCACVYVHTCMLIFRCLYLPALTQLGAWPKSRWVLPALTLLQLDSPWFIFRYFLYPGMPHI